jgi:hypothetical protein
MRQFRKPLDGRKACFMLNLEQSASEPQFQIFFRTESGWVGREVVRGP